MVQAMVAAVFSSFQANIPIEQKRGCWLGWGRSFDASGFDKIQDVFVASVVRMAFLLGKFKRLAELWDVLDVIRATWFMLALCATSKSVSAGWLDVKGVIQNSA